MTVDENSYESQLYSSLSSALTRVMTTLRKQDTILYFEIAVALLFFTFTSYLYDLYVGSELLPLGICRY